MKKKRDMIEEDDLAIYEPVNSEFRENMFMKWRAEEKGHDECGLHCKGWNKKLATRKRVPMFQP